MSEEKAAVIQAVLAEAKQLRELVQEFLVPKEGTEESKDPARMANSLYAVEAVLGIINIFSALERPSGVATFTAITDLTFALNYNPWWVANASYIMPILSSAVNACLDSAELGIKSEPRWEPMRASCNRVWLEILPAIVLRVHGYAHMRACSVRMKQSFDGVLNG